VITKNLLFKSLNLNFMKTEKLSLSSIKNVLSRAEMRKITAGSGGGSGGNGNGNGGSGCISWENGCISNNGCCPSASCVIDPFWGVGYCSA
jgi:hypothetical protein